MAKRKGAGVGRRREKRAPDEGCRSGSRKGGTHGTRSPRGEQDYAGGLRHEPRRGRSGGVWNLRKAGRRGVAAPTADRPKATGIPDKRTGFSPERGEPYAHGAQIKNKKEGTKQMFGFVEKNREKVEKLKEDRRKAKRWGDEPTDGQCNAPGVGSHATQFDGDMWKETESKGGGAIPAAERSLKTYFSGEGESQKDMIVEELKSALDSIITAWAITDTMQ